MQISFNKIIYGEKQREKEQTLSQMIRANLRGSNLSGTILDGLELSGIEVHNSNLY
jgi:uncharacterized protein YjbI with pentapeptide repeats